MKILSIETSCDDTGITIFEASGGLKKPTYKILSENLSSQDHAKYGGVFPMMAKREHQKNLPILLDAALKEAGISRERGLGSATARTRAKIQQNFMGAESARNPGLDLICVTYGPGLEPCLWTGIVFAQELGKKWKVPVMPVNHMEGHILSVYGKDKGKFTFPKIEFPIVSLLVSGGHTDLVVSKSFQKYEIIGRTKDDAAGEAFDKVARMMDLPYPGGPHISRLAERARSSADAFAQSLGPSLRSATPSQKHRASDLKPIFPRPMMYTKDFNFSFSGLKTSVLYYLQKNKKADKSMIAMEFENAVVDTLVYKTNKAVEKYKAKTLIIAGGVAANKQLRKVAKKVFTKDIKVLFPTPYLCRDNSLMIGIAGYLQYIKNKKKVPKLESIKATGKLRL